MSHFVNPLLLGRPMVTAGFDPSGGAAGAARNFAANAPAKDAGFAQELAATQKQAAAPAAAPKPSAPARTDTTAALIDPATDDESFGVTDVLDILNPLQHIPLLGMLYREVTGDTIKPVSQVVGDIGYGLVIGGVAVSVVSAIASAAFEQQTGESPLTQVADALFGGDEEAEPSNAGTTMLAQATPQAAPAPASAPAATASPPVATVAAAKQPYGGVMAPAAQQGALASSSSMTRIGNTVYAGPLLHSAARVAATRPAATPVPANASLASAAASLPLPGASSGDSATLGQMMHDSARTSQKGEPLPPDLVHDMMLMALDKYKTAEGMAPSAMKTNGTN